MIGLFMKMAFRAIVEDCIVAAFQDPDTYNIIGHGNTDQYKFKDNEIRFSNISEFLSFLGMYTCIAGSTIAGFYDNLNSTYEYIDGIYVVKLLA